MPDPSNKTAADQFTERGMAVALAELASARVMDVGDVVTLPYLLAEAGLPERPHHRVVLLAHRINRDRIDAMLWRCNRPLTEEAPMLSQRDAERYAAIGTPAAATPKTGGGRPVAPPLPASAPVPRPVAFGGMFGE